MDGNISKLYVETCPLFCNLPSHIMIERRGRNKNKNKNKKRARSGKSAAPNQAGIANKKHFNH